MPAPASYQLQKSALRVVVVLVLAHVGGELVDALGEQRDLHLGGAGVPLVPGVFLDDRLSLLCGEHALRSANGYPAIAISVTLSLPRDELSAQPPARRPPIARVAIVSDSTACIPPDLAAELGIEILPLYLEFGDEVYQDGMAEDPSEFYEKLRTAPQPPTTAAPSPGAYADALVRAGEGAEAVVCLTVSRQFSAMHAAAVQGAELARERAPQLEISVLDSTAAAMAQGFIVLEAARAARDGASLHDVIARAEALMPNVQLLVVLDTLTYLARSGRVPRLVVWASSPLQVKPIVQFRQGAYRPLTVVRTLPRAIDRLFRALEERTRGREAHICVHHTNVPDKAADLAERVRSQLQPKELLIREFTQVMGVHTGPGLLGFAFYTQPPSASTH